MSRQPIYTGNVKRVPKPSKKVTKELVILNRIVKITDRDGNDRTDGRYPLRVGRKCVIVFDKLYIGLPMFLIYKPDPGDNYRGVRMTSPVIDYNYKDGLFIVKTAMSIYYFERINKA